MIMVIRKNGKRLQAEPEAMKKSGEIEFKKHLDWRKDWLFGEND